MQDRIDLTAGAARAEIALLGAEARRWSVDGVDLLWEPDAAVWSGVSPVLFPIVGWARDGLIRVEGQHYPMGVHGFASVETFEVIDRRSDFVSLALHSNDATLARYPFRFELRVDYRLRETGLSVDLCVENLDTKPMPYACGLHPGFRWPFGNGSREGGRIFFDAIESADVPEIAPGGLFSNRMRAIPLEGRTLALSDELLAREALCILDARSRAIVFDNGAGQAIRVTADGFRHWALWSRPPSQFLCVEAWTGHGDPEHFAGELRDKPSMILLEPGERRRHKAMFAFVRN